MATPALKLLAGRYSIHRFHKSAEIPARVFRSDFVNIVKTDEELSIVCPGELELPSERCEGDWACIKVMGPLAFDSFGILAGLTRILAEAGIAIFVISTFDTDYILVKSAKAQEAKAALKEAGYPIV